MNPFRVGLIAKNGPRVIGTSKEGGLSSSSSGLLSCAEGFLCGSSMVRQNEQTAEKSPREEGQEAILKDLLRGQEEFSPES